MSNVSTYNLKQFYGEMKTTSPLYKYQFIVEFFGNDLNSDWCINSNSTDAAKNISYLVTSANIPGVTLTTANVTYLGTAFRLPGVKQFGHSWDCKVFLEENLKLYKGFRKWQEYESSLTKDGGGIKKIPNIQARISLLDPNGSEKKHAFILEGVWAKTVGDISLAYADGGGKAITNFPLTLRYQYCYRDDSFNEKNISSDPLKA